MLKCKTSKHGRRITGKQHGTMRKPKHRGIAATGGGFLLNLIAYNLVRIPKLMDPTPELQTLGFFRILLEQR